MRNFKILQVIPASHPVYCLFKDEAGMQYTGEFPVIAWALVQEEDRFRFVAPLDVDPEGFVSIASEQPSFVGVTDERILWSERRKPDTDEPAR